MQFAKLLHSCGFHITFVNSESNNWRLLQFMGPDQLQGLPNFQFETIPDGLPVSDKVANPNIPSFFCSTVRIYLNLTHLRQSPETGSDNHILSRTARNPKTTDNIQILLIIVHYCLRQKNSFLNTILPFSFLFINLHYDLIVTTIISGFPDEV
ncbi:hypothetical protein GIB67_031370 [Kingdonia uniflora]|uniref:Uncharacterized protein n=1 Tax=Kingdonia uniflora TaxID=39325 RepID=A0A7J7MBB6_9MAGN|nr:hypothetical protein GIB67_031370 [Kingdonia uniflora]